jgi:ABC-type multidrug transport system fused ATPase/permease subunit
LIDHQDIREFSLDALKRQIAYVPQDVYLFAGSVLENIRLGRPEASLEEVERAARMAQAHEFISALPNGYETVCGESIVIIDGGKVVENGRPRDKE